MIHLDTSALIDALTGPKRSAPRLRKFIESGERIHLSAIVIFEWRRGPRSSEELDDQESLFPGSEGIPFGPAEAVIAADLYRKVRRARGREIDIALAATAIAHDAHFWTLNLSDFKDIPNLKLV